MDDVVVMGALATLGLVFVIFTMIIVHLKGEVPDEQK
jgi:hypothetical protein